MATDSRYLSNRLAIDGGMPVRSTPLPWELPGAYYIDEEEKRLVDLDYAYMGKNDSAFQEWWNKSFKG